MSSYSSLFRVLSPSRAQIKFEELPIRSNTLSIVFCLCCTVFFEPLLILDLCVCSRIFKMRKALTCYVMGMSFNEFTIVVADEILIDNISVPISDFNVGLLKKHIWKEISKKFDGYGVEPNDL